MEGVARSSTVSNFGRLDILVDNASVGEGLHTIVDEIEEQEISPWGARTETVQRKAGSCKKLGER